MKVMVLLLGFIVLSGLLLVFPVYSQGIIPEWIKNNAKWWSEGQISDSDFVVGIEYMIKNDIIIIQDLPKPTDSGEETIPDWIKNNAGWWVEGLITEDDFVKGIEYLVKVGIIRVYEDESSLGSVTTNNLSAVVESCTREHPQITYPDYDKYVSGDCLIEKAESAQDCLAYADVVVIETKVIDSLGNVKKVKVYFDEVEMCVTRLAILAQDANVCDSLENNTQCIVSYVQEFETPETCKKADDLEECFKVVSITFGPEVCKSIGNQDGILSCVEYYFSSPDVLVLVEYLDNNQSYQQCLDGSRGLVKMIACGLKTLPISGLSTTDLITWKSDNNLLVCSPFQFPSSLNQHDYCLASLGVFTKDLSICDQAGIARAECYGFMADTEDFVTLSTCDKLETGVTFCYMHVAYRLNDISICDKAESNKENCIRLVNSKNN